jgi:adenylate cyclase
MDIQVVLKAENARLPPERSMAFRIGVNFGDKVEGDRTYGDGINVAVRLKNLADQGNSCICGTVYEQVRYKLPLSHEDSGEETVKNIAHGVRVRQVLLGGSASLDCETWGASSRYWHASVFSFMGLAIIATAIVIVRHPSLRPQPTHPSISTPSSVAIPIVQAAALSSSNKPSIAVLLLANVKTDPAQQYLRIGVTDQPPGDFFKRPGLFVTDPKSSLAYKGKSINVEEVNREANMHFSEHDNGREIEISAGQTFEISLTETRTAGFRWIITSSGEPVCRVVKDSFDNSSKTPGQSGTHQWNFMVDTPGTATIELAYRRQWQSKSPPARTYTLRIRAGG